MSCADLLNTTRASEGGKLVISWETAAVQTAHEWKEHVISTTLHTCISGRMTHEKKEKRDIPCLLQRVSWSLECASYTQNAERI